MGLVGGNSNKTTSAVRFDQCFLNVLDKRGTQPADRTMTRRGTGTVVTTFSGRAGTCIDGTETPLALT